MNRRKFRFLSVPILVFLLIHERSGAQGENVSWPWGPGCESYCIARGEAYFYGLREVKVRGAPPHLYRFDLATSTVSRMLDNDTERNLLKDGARQLDISSDGRLLTLSAAAGNLRRGATRILLVSTGTGDVKVLVWNERNNIFPKFSPDGGEVAFYHSHPDMERNNWDLFHTKGFALSVVNIATGEMRQLASEDWRLMRDGPPSWSPEGKYLAYAGAYGKKSGGEIYIVPAEGGESRRISPEASKSCCRPVWLNKDVVLYSASGPEGWGLYAVRSDGTDNRLLYRGAVETTPDISPDGKRICFAAASLEKADLGQVKLIVLDVTGKPLPGPHSDVVLHKWRR